AEEWQGHAASLTASAAENRPLNAAEAASLYRRTSSAAARSRRRLPLLRLRVLDPRVIQRDQALAQALLDHVQLRQRQTALLELAVEQPLHEHVVHQLAQATRRRLRQRPAGALDGIRQHHDAALARLRLRPRIAERRLQRVRLAVVPRRQ